jgi:hypothetical protein
MMFALRSALFSKQKPRKSELTQMIQNSPKAEVRGSNPFGRANVSSRLSRWYQNFTSAGKRQVSTAVAVASHP